MLVTKCITTEKMLKRYNVYFIVIRLHSRDPVNCSDNWNSFLRNLVNINNVNCGGKKEEKTI